MGCLERPNERSIESCPQVRNIFCLIKKILTATFCEHLAVLSPERMHLTLSPTHSFKTSPLSRLSEWVRDFCAIVNVSILSFSTETASLVRCAINGHLAWTAQHASGNRGDDFRALKLAELQPYTFLHPNGRTPLPRVLGLQGEEKAGAARGMRTICSPNQFYLKRMHSPDFLENKSSV